MNPARRPVWFALGLIAFALATVPFLVGRQNPPPSTIDRLIHDLGHPDSSVSAPAVQFALELSAAELRELAGHLDHENPRTRLKIAFVLAKSVKPIDEPTAHEVLRQIDGQTPGVVEHLLTALGASGIEGDDVAAAAGKFLDDSSRDVSRAAIRLLGAQGAAARPYVPKLTKVGRNDLYIIADAVADAAKRLGKNARGLEPALDNIVRWSGGGFPVAVEVLGEIGSPEALDILVKVITAQYPQARYDFPTQIPNACRALASFGPAATAALPALAALYRNGPKPPRTNFLDAIVADAIRDRAHAEECKSAAAAAIRAIDPAKAKELGIAMK